MSVQYIALSDSKREWTPCWKPHLLNLWSLICNYLEMWDFNSFVIVTITNHVGSHFSLPLQPASHFIQWHYPLFVWPETDWPLCYSIFCWSLLVTPFFTGSWVLMELFYCRTGVGEGYSMNLYWIKSIIYQKRWQYIVQNQIKTLTIVKLSNGKVFYQGKDSII